MSVLLDALKKAALEKQTKELNKNTSEKKDSNPESNDSSIKPVQDTDSNTSDKESSEYLESGNLTNDPGTSDTSNDGTSSANSHTLEVEYESDASGDQESSSDRKDNVQPEEVVVYDLEMDSEYLEELESVVELDDDEHEKIEENIESQQGSPSEKSIDDVKQEANVVSENDQSDSHDGSRSGVAVELNGVSEREVDLEQSIDNENKISEDKSDNDTETKESVSSGPIHKSNIAREEHIEKTKATFNRLRENKKIEVRKNKIKLVVVYTALLLLSLAIVGGYYYFFVYSVTSNVLSKTTAQPVPYNNINSVDPETLDDLGGSNSLSDQSGLSSEVDVEQAPESVVESEVENASGHNNENIAAIEQVNNVTNKESKVNDAPSNSVNSNNTPSNRANREKTGTTKLKQDGSRNELTKNDAREAQAVKSTRIEKPNSARSVVKKQSEDNRIGSSLSSQSAIVKKGKVKQDPYTSAIDSGYQAFLAGDLTTAKRHYTEALRINSYGRDALLGNAALAMAEKRYQAALNYYQSRLARSPKDTYALSGILSIAGIDDPSPELISNVNELLADNPEAAYLHFLQGSLLAANNRWNAAQESFFKAWSREPSRAEYVLNLAISLDHLNKTKEALQFYRQALSLSSQSAVAIDVDSIARRVQQLEEKQ